MSKRPLDTRSSGTHFIDHKHFENNSLKFLDLIKKKTFKESLNQKK